jgi:hypothetical protein
MDGIRSSLPPLDPNGQPFSMILRGAAAELGDLRYTLLSNPNATELLQMLMMESTTEVDDCDDKFDDVEEMNSDQQHQQVNEYKSNGVRTEEITEDKKRGRDCYDDNNDEGSDNDEDEVDEISDQEKLLLYVPSITCTCSSWKMKDVAGSMLITSIRVLFLPNDDQTIDENVVSMNDVAIDGRCIALHAVDTVSSSSPIDEENDDNAGQSQQHVYCQLIESTGDEDDMGFSSTMSMVVPSKIVDEKHDTLTDDDEKYNEVNEEGDEDSDEDGADGAIEVYFKPIISDDDGVEGEDGNTVCERIFNSLTKLASLNPVGDFSDDECNGGGGGGGFFNMLSLMAGMDGNDNDNDGADEMVFRLGGSNNFVENDEEDSEIMVSDAARQAMLRRLDHMLVVPPEYEISSSNEDDGQYDDADDVIDEEDDKIL